MKKGIIGIVFVVTVIILVSLIFDWGRGDMTDINQITHITVATSSPLIILYPEENQEVTSPIHIAGKAKGNWFFEASFPIRLTDTKGDIIASGHAQALGNWMTSEYVDFTADIVYPKATTTARGLLEFSKDNPSGNPEFDQSIFIPVILK